MIRLSANISVHNMNMLLNLLFPMLVLFLACDEAKMASKIADNSIKARVVSVEVSGSPQSYIFSVGISSPDTGCDQYADWWEVVDENGILIYRRILAHSHVSEQPFVRSGGPIGISDDQMVWVRAHMNTVGYGSQGFKGTINGGFFSSELDDNFATELAQKEPLPDGCDF